MLTTYILESIRYLWRSCLPSSAVVINGQSYKILRLLGEGGFSYVYLVQGTSLLALKQIRCPFEESMSLARKEIESYARFSHPNVIRAVDHSIEDDTVNILLPYYRQGNLQDAINANIINKTEFEEARLVDIFRQVCHGLKAMHDQGYAHRDVKPGNIILDEQAILMDLGSVEQNMTVPNRTIALQVQDAAAEHSTMPYRAPELFDVKTGAIDGKVDVWSLGCTMHACLTGKSPFEARSEETGGSLSLCVLGGDWREAAGDSVLKSIIRKCLTVEPSERPNVDDLLAMM